MTDKSHMCLLGLILLSALITGISGVDETRVFCSSGENVRLSCNNALSGCTSTTWIYSRHSETVELIAGGIKKNNIERYERLNLDSDCSLNIEKVTKEDRGSYSCRQYVNDVQQGTDARVYLHVLHVSSSSSQSEIRSGRSVTLSCQLYYDLVSSYCLVGSESIELIWVNQADVNLKTDSRFQISSSGRCNISLNTTLLNEDHNREWRCQVKQRNQVKTSVTYTVKYSAPTETKTPSPVTRSTSTTAPPQPVSPSVIGIVAAAASAVLPALILWVICKKPADNRKGTNDSEFTDKNNVTSDSVSNSIHLTPSTNEHTDDVTYTEVATHCKIQARKEVSDDDTVTYSSIRGATAGPPDDCSQLYASVNKNHHK